MDEDVEIKQIRARKKREFVDKMKGQEISLEKKYPNVPVTVKDSTFDQMIRQYPLMVIDCWAPWCGPCHMIAPTIEEMAKDYVGKVVFGKLNVDENPEISRRFEILGIPTLLIMKNAKEVDRIVGVAPKQLIEAKLRKYL